MNIIILEGGGSAPQAPSLDPTLAEGSVGGVHWGRDCMGEGCVGGQWEEGECRRGKGVWEGSGECMGLCMHGGGECRRGEGSGECMGKGRPGSVWGGGWGGGGGGVGGGEQWGVHGGGEGSVWGGGGVGGGEQWGVHGGREGIECMGEGECRRGEGSIVHGGRVEGSAWGRGLLLYNRHIVIPVLMYISLAKGVTVVCGTFVVNTVKGKGTYPQLL